MLSASKNLFIVIFFLAFTAIGCDPLIKVHGNVEELTTPLAEGQITDKKQHAVPGVKVVLRPKEKPERGFKATTNETGAYVVSGIITAAKSGWNWSEGWEIVFEKDGYKTSVIELDPKRHKDNESNMKWQYRVDAILSPDK